MNTSDTVRTLIDFALVVIAIFLMFNDRRIAAWERRTARKILRWAVKSIPALRRRIYGEKIKNDTAHMPVRLINDWRNSNARK